jgi:replicative DNA helicase
VKALTPQNAEAEVAAVACLLLGASPDLVPLREDHFAAEDCRLIFAAVRSIADKPAPVDANTVTAHLRATGRLDAAGGHMARFLEAAPLAGGDALLAHYFEHLERARQQREAVRFIVESLPELSALRLDAPTFAEELAARCAPLAASSGHTMNDIAAELEQRPKGHVAEVFPTGLCLLDKHLGGGFHRGELAVVGGDTGAGKSALLIQAAACAAAAHPVIYLSLEMPREDIFNRISAAASGTPPEDDNFRHAQCAAAALPITIHDNISALPDIVAAIRTAARRGKAAVAVVDYLQLVECHGDTRELAMAETSRRLKTLALAEQIFVLTASQLNDDGRLRESRTIGHNADCVLAIEQGDGIAVRKFRRGPRDVLIPAKLDGPTSRFVTAAQNSPRRGVPQP